MQLEVQGYLLGAFAALLVGVSKSGLPGLSILVVPLMAMVWPSKISIAALLPLLILGDLFALAWYRRHADWRKLLALAPWVVVGMAAAGLLLAHLNSDVLRPLLGGLVLAMLALELARQRFGWRHAPTHPAVVGFTGWMAGFATTAGNAAGPIMNLYLLSRGLTKEVFIGTAAWFFFCVNGCKVPIYASLGLFSADTLRFDLWMAPAVLLGTGIGIAIQHRISKKVFNAVVMALTLLAALKLMIG